MPISHLSNSMFRLTSAIPKLGITSGGMGILALVLFLTTAGCTSDAENIRATNVAAATPPVTSTPLSAEIGSTEIQDGDCINSRLPEGIDIESVVIVPCNANWQYRALSSFEVVDVDRYPGQTSFQRRAYRECDRRHTFTLFPTEDSWRQGDRKVICLQESFGLSLTDPARLDRLITNRRLEVEECFNETPEHEVALVELVSCSGEWQYRILNAFTVDDHSRYPGEGHFAQRAYGECDRRYASFLFPTIESWSLGDRTFRCLQESFGLSGADSAQLDRLVNSDRLNADECFNEAPETDNLLVELVSCSGEWQYRTLNIFAVNDVSRYPGEDSFNQAAYRECDRSYTLFLFPTADSWSLGDRKITCLRESFGLSGTDPARLDRLVNRDRLNADECFNEAPETGNLLVEVVSCSGGWQYRTLNIVAVDGVSRYPGETSFDQRAFGECDRRYTTFRVPTPETWAWGDRTVTCLQESFGLSVTDLRKLDRLVNRQSIKVDECFNQAPETDHILEPILITLRP